MKAVKKQEKLTMNEFGLKDAANCPEMWPGGSWQQWPLQPSMFQNIPHEQIDWAALAQQWIQMRETRGDGSSNDQPPPPMIGGNVHIPPRPVDSNKQMKLENTVESLDEGSNSQDTNSFRQGDWNYWGNSNWSVNNPPPPAWNASLHANEAKESLPPYEFGQAHGNQGFAAQSYDYNHGSDQYGYNQVYVEQNQFNQYWPGGQSGAIFPRKEHRLQIPEREGIPTIREDEEMAAMTSNLDAAKRKQLPAWIREGLEKMEREKQKRLEKERLLKEREGQLKSMKEAEERAMKEFMNDRGGESLIPRKSKFDSDSEEEEEEDLPKKSPSPLKRKYSSGEEEEDDEPKSDEEKLADLMMRVRQLLTEILLEVTNEEVTQIAKEVLNRAKAKAPAMQLASSSALASITRGLGLAEYGSDESENSGGEGDDAVDSDVDLQASINQRKKEFTEKEKEIVAGLKSEDSDIDLDDEKKQIGCDFIQPTSEREKYHFEKKYSEIPGLDVAPLTDENSTSVQEISIKVEKDLESKQSADKSITNNSSSESDSERDSRTSSSSRGRETCWKSAQNEKSQRRDRNRSSSRERDRRDDRRRRSRSRDRRRSRSSSRSRRSRNFNRDRSDSRDRRSSYGSRSSRDWNSRKERSRRSRSTSHSSTRRQRRDRGRRNSRSYSRSRSRSPRKYSSRRGRENSRRESRSPSGEGSGKKSSRKQTT